MYNRIKEICDTLIEIYDTRDPFELCDSLGIKIIETNLSNNILGFFQRINNEHEIIYLNNDIPCYRTKEYVCFHEIGHVVAHPELSICFLESSLYITNKYEREADMFAAEFLIPDDFEICQVEGMTAKQLSGYFKVPEKLIELKFRN